MTWVPKKPALILAPADALDRFGNPRIRGGMLADRMRMAASGRGYIGAPAAGYTAWFRADDYAGGTWDNREGTAGQDLVLETQITSFTETQPTATASDANFNGLASVDFNGSTDVMKGSAISNYITNSAHNIFVVARWDTAGSADNANGLLPVLYDHNGFFGLGLGLTAMTGFNWDGSSDVVTLAASTATSYGVEFKHDSGNILVDLTGGATEATVASGNTSTITGTLRVGASHTATPSKIFNGQIADIIIYNSVLSAGDRTTTRNYIANSYGLTW